MKVTFQNVGRDKRTWTAETERLSETWVLSQITKSKSLMSREISISMDGDAGLIFAGHRQVGTIAIEGH